MDVTCFFANRRFSDVHVSASTEAAHPYVAVTQSLCSFYSPKTRTEFSMGKSAPDVAV